MSKIAEQKALEAYPQKIGYTDMGDVDWNLPQRNAYLLGYDQAMQDFLEKAEKFFKNELYVSVSDQICSQNDFTSMPNFVKYFKNYMQNEM